MNLILLGAPGSGKGTQGVLLAKRLGVPKISMGDLLRRAVAYETPLGRQARTFMDQGLLVPDEIILGLIAEVLGVPEAAGGILMDGFPRTVPQAEAVDGLLQERNTQVDRVLLVDVPEEELVRRLLGRAEKEGRADDTLEAIQQRLVVYAQQTEPLVAYYRARSLLAEIPGSGTVEEIAGRVREVLGA